ncbi:MAG: hypothetical protein R3B57_00925 [Phycisphaerales bacterium]
MIATITQTTALLPAHVSEPDLLADFLAAELPLLALCERHAIDLDDLTAWLDHPRTRERLAALERAAATRERLVTAQARVAAAVRLRDLAAFPADYADKTCKLTPAAAETARKAAARLLAPAAGRASSPSSPLSPAPRGGDRSKRAPDQRG